MEKDTPNTSMQTVRQENCKIRHLNNSESLRKELIGISYLLGVKEAPNEMVMTQMVNILKDEFDYFTVQDITNAVKKALSGKLNIDFQPYNNFSIPYICKILTAYREYLRNENKLLPKVQESSEMTPKQERDTTTSWLNNHVYPRIEKFFKTGEYDLPDYGNTLYNYLDKKFINFTSERKKEIKEQARQELLKEFRIEKTAKPRERNRIGTVITDIIMSGKETEGLVRTRAKKLALNIFLAECKETDRNLIAEIKEYEK